MKNGVRIMFLRDHNAQPQGCIAITINDKEQFAYYRLSVLNPVDRFNRELARSLATGRLYSGGIPVRIPKNANMHDISRAVMTDITKNPQTPTRAVRLAKYWLRKTDQKIFVSN
jgi:hypothetical protein